MSRSLRTARLRRLGILTSIVAFGIAVFVPIDTSGDLFFWGPVFDAGHYPLFFLVTFFLAVFLPREIPRLPPWVGNPYFIAAILAVGIEGIQPIFDRDASIPDTLNGLLGIAAAGILLENWRRKPIWSAHIVTIVFLGGIFLALLFPTIPAMQAILWRKHNFPKLASFSAPEEELLWETIPPGEDQPDIRTSDLTILEDSTFSDGAALSVQTKTGFWAGVRYAAGDMPWGLYAKLILEITNPSDEEFSLHVRIDDNQDCKKFYQRYNATQQLTPGPNTFAIDLSDIQKGPRDRELDVNKIRRILFFTGKTDKSRNFIIDEVRLQ